MLSGPVFAGNGEEREEGLGVLRGINDLLYAQMLKKSSYMLYMSSLLLGSRWKQEAKEKKKEAKEKKEKADGNGSSQP